MGRYAKLLRCFLILLLAVGIFGAAKNSQSLSLGRPQMKYVETKKDVQMKQPLAVQTVSARSAQEAQKPSKMVSVLDPDGSAHNEIIPGEGGSEEESSIVPTQIVVNTDSLAEEDKGRVTYQMDSYYVLEYEDEEAAKEALERYGVQEDAEASYVKRVHIMDTGSEDYQYKSWGPQSIHSGEFCRKILERYGSDSLPEVTVGIIDTGVDYNHEFLKERMGSCQYDFVDDDGDAMDEHFHGTHVAGIIADTTLPNVKLNAYRALDANGYGTDADIAAAIEQAVEDRVDVINLSLGGLGTSAIESAALDKAIAADIVVVAAAGNEKMNAGGVFPASYPEALTVAALRNNGNGQVAVADYSNFGAVIDVCAPGSGVNSSVLNQQYASKDGTSMAAPFVAASAALLRTYDKTASYIAVSDTLKTHARDLDAKASEEKRFNIYSGYGEVDLSSIDRVEQSASLVGEPRFDKDAGEYDEPIQVSLTSSDADAVIYYTTDGSIPTGDVENPAEQIYTQPVVIDKSCDLIAVAKKTGEDHKEQMSTVASARYYIGGMGMEDDFATDDRGYISAYTGYQTKLVIPDVIKGQPVVGIRRAAFQGNGILRDVTIPDTIVCIESFAFNITCLERFYLGKSVKELGERWLTSGWNGEFPRELIVDKENPYFTVKDDVLYTSDMKELVIYSPYKEDQIFQIPDTVKNVRAGGFFTNKLRTLEVPASVEDLGGILGFTNLLINVDEGNRAYSSDHGILYNKDKTEIYLYTKAQTAAEYKMPDSVRRVHESCFHNDNLKSITLSKNLQVIGTRAFDFQYVEKFVIPSTVISIGDYALHTYGKKPLSLYFDGSLPWIGNKWAYTNNGEKVKVYHYSQAPGFERLPEAEYELYDRTDGSYPDIYEVYTVEEGGALLFNVPERKIIGYIGELGDLSIPSEIAGVPVEKIGEKAFKNCETITAVIIPSSVMEIGEEAFSFCPILTSVKVAGSVRIIPPKAFSNNHMLKEIVLEEGVQKVGWEAFRDSGDLWFSDVTYYHRFLAVSLPSSLEEIEDYAFAGCDTLRSLDLPEGLVRIGKEAFANLYYLSVVALPESLRSIDDYAFYNSRACLENLDIPEGVEYIGSRAFSSRIAYVYRLSVTIRGDAGEIGEEAFGTDATVYYEKGAGNFDQPTLSIYSLQMLDKLPDPSRNPVVRAVTDHAILLEQYEGHEYISNFGGSWQESALFTGLKENTGYQFSIRKAGAPDGAHKYIIYSTASRTYPITAKYGSTLGQCVAKLPQGFVFEQEPSVRVGEVGDQEFAIRYDTEDKELAKELAWMACIHVEKAKPQIEVKPSASGIVWGETLGDSQLSGGLVQGVDGEEVSGTWRWSDDAVRPEGSQNCWVMFEPKDDGHYMPVKTMITVQVEKMIPQIASKPQASAITLGETLGASKLSGGLVQGLDGEEVTGTWRWSDAGIKPGLEDIGRKSYQVVFEPVEEDRYTAVETTVEVQVEKITPQIVSKPQATAITLGETLGASKLSGGLVQGLDGEEVSGTWRWSDAGIKPGLEDIGRKSYQVVFEPVEEDRYTAAETTVEVQVEKITPQIVSKPQATAITLGETLGASKLSGGLVQGLDGEEVSGTWRWMDAGIKPGLEDIGRKSYQILFEPVEEERYTSVETTVEVQMEKMTPQIVSKPQATAITLGETLVASKLSGGLVQGIDGEEVSGTWRWINANIRPGLEGLGEQSYWIVFEPVEEDRYMAVETMVGVQVERMTPQIASKPQATAITLGETLGASELLGGLVQGLDGEEVSGTWRWKDVGIKPGLEDIGRKSYQIVFEPVEEERYTSVETTVEVQMEKMTPQIVSKPQATAITLGETLGASELSGGLVQGIDGEEVSGTWRWKDAGIKPGLEDSGKQSYPIVFEPVENEIYTAVETSVKIKVKNSVKNENPKDKVRKITKISISADSKKIAAGKKVTLKAVIKPKNATISKVKWTSGNKKYAAVNSRGVVSTKKAGAGKTVKITASAIDGSGKKAAVTIRLMRNAVTGIKIKNAPKTLKAGKSIALRTVIKTNGRNANKTLKWASSKSKYASVNVKGKVMAKKAGRGKTVVISASATDGSNKKAKIRIRIK